MYQAKNRVLIIGDIMLDQYFCGIVKRVSPEAPVPVVSLEEERNALGGAANVANNVASLDCEAALLGFIGNDSCGNTIIEKLKIKGININGLITIDKIKTITKTRIIGNGQQLLRLDANDEICIEEDDYERLVNKFISVKDQYDIVIISDYDKGTCSLKLCQTVIKICKKDKKIIIVDPKGTNWEKYEYADIITPNLKELCDFLGEDVGNEDHEIKIHSENINERLKIENIILTRAEKGMSLIRNNLFRSYPAKAKEVFDVSGAGDTVVASIACTMEKLNTDGLESAIEIANVTAGITVAKKGTSTVTRSEIEQELYQNTYSKLSKKIFNIESLIVQINKWRENKESIVVTNGCFDIIHKGHIHTIYSAAELGGRLVLALNSDTSVKRLKGESRPINNQEDRSYVLAALDCVDAIVVFEEDTPELLLSRIRPDVLVKGGDYALNEISGAQFAKEVKVVSLLKGYSTSNIALKLYDD